MKSDRFAPGSTGRDIIDETALRYQDRNIELFNTCKDMPPYFGKVNIGEERTALTPVKSRGKLGRQKLIADVIEGTRNLALKDTPAYVLLVGANKSTRKVYVNPVLIKFIKTCVVCSYNSNSDFSDVLTFFVHEVTGHCDDLVLPIDYHSANKTQKIVAKELNEFLKELCDENGIKYGEVVQVKRAKKSNTMAETVRRIGENKYGEEMYLLR